MRTNEPRALTSWNELFARHERFVFRLAYDLVHDRHLAEDLVQQTWLTAIERPPTARRSLKGWLATVLRNLAIDHFRIDRSPRAQADDDLAHTGEASYADEEEASSIRQTVLDSLHELDPIYRDVLHLHYIEGQTIAAVAENLSLPLETARTRCRRGLSRLRDRLDRRYGGRRPWVAALAPFALRAPEAWLAPGAGAQQGEATTSAVQGARSSPIGSGAAIGARLLPAAFVLVPSIALVAFIVLGATRDARPALAAADPGADIAREDARLSGAPDPSARVALTASRPGGELTAASIGPTRVRVRHAGTGEPLAGVHVLLQAESAEVHVDSPVLVSDGDGWIDLEDAGPGRWTLRPERGPAILVDLPRRDALPLELSVPEGIEVRGRVVDPSGTPLPFATVHVTWPAWIRVREAATCDAAGAFHLPHVDPTSQITGADELGFGWMAGFESPDFAGLASVRTDLVVPGPGRVVEGVVVDEAGHPLAGVSVRGLGRLRTTAELPDPTDPSRGGLQPPAEIATTGADGRFRLGHFRDDVERVPVTAWREGYARASAVALDEGPIEVRMEREAVVEGTARTPDGAPVAWARIAAFVPGQPQPSIARADGQGRFRLTRLPAGRLTLEVLSDRTGSESWLEGELELFSGRTTRWDPVLGAVARIAGSLVDGAGRPLPGWIVQVVAEPHIESHRVTGRFNDNRLIRSTLTDGEGRFAFFGCKPAPHLVKAYDPHDASGFPRAWQWGVVIDGAEVLLRADENTAPRAGLRGSLVLPDGVAPQSAQIRLYSRLIGRSLTFEAAKGSGIFDIGPLPPTGYRMSVWTMPGGPVNLAPVELGPGEVVDLGDVLVQPRADAGGEGAPSPSRR